MARLTTDNALLPERARQGHPHGERRKRRRLAHRAHDPPSASANDVEDRAAAVAIDSWPMPMRAGGADDRRPEVQLAVADAIDVEIGKQRFRDQAEALGAARERPHHGGGRHHEHVAAGAGITTCGEIEVGFNPAARLVEAAADRSTGRSQNGRSGTPMALPAKAATSHSQPCRLPDAMPLKYAPMLQPYEIRAP